MRLGLTALTVLLVLTGALGSGASVRADSVTIGSKKFPESQLLAEILAQLIEAHTDLDVVRATNLGGTMIAHAALLEGEIDLYPEYTGTAWSVIVKERERVSDPLRVYLHVRREYERRFGVTWLDPFGFQNGYALALRTEVAERLGVSRISDLAAVDEELTVTLGHEFLSREDGWPGLTAWYPGLATQDPRGTEHGLAFEAIRSGRSDLIEIYTTDGRLKAADVRLLEDDRQFFPPYDCAPVVRTDTLARHPSLDAVIGRLAFTIDDARMIELNHAVEVERRPFDAVAREFLTEEGLIDDGGAPAAKETRRDVGFFELFWSRRGHLLDLTIEHIGLTAIAVFFAALLAIPLGVLLTRRPRLAGPVLTAAGVLQTIPSLALLAFMIPLLGIGVPAALAALFLYALLPIVRNTYTGIREVDAELVEAAVGMGLTDGQILRLVELPLATRTIMAGVRTSTVISIGVATLAAFISAGGLGDEIVTGLQLNEPNLVLCGAVPAALLAVLADGLLGLAESRLAPRT